MTLKVTDRTDIYVFQSLFHFLFAFSQPLSELEHLNLGYNCLQRAPTLGLSARARLATLILRNNELETINGTASDLTQAIRFSPVFFSCRCTSSPSDRADSRPIGSQTAEEDRASET